MNVQQSAAVAAPAKNRYAKLMRVLLAFVIDLVVLSWLFTRGGGQPLWMGLPLAMIVGSLVMVSVMRVLRRPLSRWAAPRGTLESFIAGAVFMASINPAWTMKARTLLLGIGVVSILLPPWWRKTGGGS